MGGLARKSRKRRLLFPLLTQFVSQAEMAKAIWGSFQKNTHSQTVPHAEMAMAMGSIGPPSDWRSGQHSGRAPEIRLS